MGHFNGSFIKMIHAHLKRISEIFRSKRKEGKEQSKKKRLKEKKGKGNKTLWRRNHCTK